MANLPRGMHRLRWGAFVAGLFVGLCALAAGCDRGRELGQVRGKVTFDGQPFQQCLVVFGSMETGVFMTARPDAQGAFVVEMAEGRGLPLGAYQVSVRPAPPDNWDRPPPPSAIPRRYFDPATSGLSLQVVSGENNCDVPLLSADHK